MVGGQEFDAVICLGLERGITPKVIPDDAVLQSTLEQQALRDIYLAVTRARHEVYIFIDVDREPTEIVKQAYDAGLMKKESLVGSGIR